MVSVWFRIVVRMSCAQASITPLFIVMPVCVVQRTQSSTAWNNMENLRHSTFRRWCLLHSSRYHLLNCREWWRWRWWSTTQRRSDILRFLPAAFLVGASSDTHFSFRIYRSSFDANTIVCVGHCGVKGTQHTQHNNDIIRYDRTPAYAKPINVIVTPEPWQTNGRMKRRNK